MAFSIPGCTFRHISAHRAQRIEPHFLTSAGDYGQLAERSRARPVCRRGQLQESSCC